MTLHRKHHTLNPHTLAVRLSLRDQLDLQRVVTYGVDVDAGYFYLADPSPLAVEILKRHGVAVSLDEHTGRVTFNPEVIDA